MAMPKSKRARAGDWQRRIAFDNGTAKRLF
jgi:hypothetical protein